MIYELYTVNTDIARFLSLAESKDCSILVLAHVVTTIPPEVKLIPWRDE